MQALSRLLPLRDTLWTIPRSRGAPTNSSRWCCQPMSICMTGLAQEGFAAASAARNHLYLPMFGLPEIDHATISPLPKS